MIWILTFVLAYLLGSVPFGYLLVRAFRHEDIRTQGSGNIGATNVARSGAKGLGLATLFLDAFKGWLAVVLTHGFAKHYGMGPIDAQNLAAIAAIGAVLGHMFPVWLGFRGGKGVATALGVFIALSWPAALCALGVFAVVFLLLRYVSLASIVGALSLPFFFWWLTPNRTGFSILIAFAIALLVIVKHHTNISRLMAGTEDRFDGKRVSTL
jgi:glycerol-3-phosphate acyltransferase PlsY